MRLGRGWGSAVEGFLAPITGRNRGASYPVAGWVTLRGLGLVYLIAFVSFWVQVEGLIGPSGILPANELLDLVHRQLGLTRFWFFPTVFWLGSGPAALHLVCAIGTLSALLLLFDCWPTIQTIVLWSLYLSLSVVARDFLSFQWDTLLLEAGLIGILLAGGRAKGWFRAPEPDSLAVVLVWFLVFRLVFESGVVKLTSGDPTWRNLTALDYHFFTQPIPSWTAWLAQQTPEWLKRVSVAMMFALELGGPLLVWAGTRGRRVGFIAIAALQLGIFATGNFAFFNLLTVVVALPLLDDRVWSRLLPAALVERLASPERPAPTPGRIKTGFEITLLFLGTLTLLGTFWPRLGYSWPIRAIEQFRSVNPYGLFRVMTTTRPQIVVEGSSDGTEWKPYRFKYQAVDLEERPRLVEPHQPRLDWQLWFAALGRFETETWFQAFLLRLLEGSKPVTGLLADNPFPAEPPRYVRALLYDYRFTSWSERARTGAWWRRTLIGEYAPVLSLTAFRRP